MPAAKPKQQTLAAFLSSSPPSSPSKSRPLRKRTRYASTSSSSHSDKTLDADSDVAAIRFEPEFVDLSDQEFSPRRPKKRKNPIPTGDESLREVTQRKDTVELDSDDDTRPRKRKLIKGVRPPSPEDDDDFDILDARNLVESRLRSRGKMSAFQKNLEKFKLLKGKKRGEIVLESSSEAEHSESSRVVPFKSAKPHHSGESDVSHESDNTNDGEDESFIVADDADDAPATQLPLAFSLSTHQDLTHQFKIVCQLFVHLAVRPLVDRRPFLERALKEEEYLSVPLQVTRRKLSGLRDSLVASSMWKSDFKKALETYPNFTLVRLNFAIPQCDACHLGNRVSTLLGRLSGKPYDKYDFEDLSDDESDESSEGGEDSDANDTRKEFHLGRFCAARTQVYHQFSHWEHSLYKSLQREIMEAQDETRRFVRVAYFGGIKPPRDLHDADKVMEWLDERGIIDMEWQKVRQMMDSARNLEKGETDG